MRREYADGTYLELGRYPFAEYVTGRAMCSDGQIRKLKRIAPSADTFFSVPASVAVKGKTVAGYVTVECVSGLSTESETDPAMVKFIAVQYGRNADMLPRGAWRVNSPYATHEEMDR